MRKLLFIAALAVLAGCKDDPEQAFYDVRFEAEASKYPVRVGYGLGSMQKSDSIYAAFDTTLRQLKGGEAAFVDLTSNDNDTANILKVKITYSGKAYSNQYPENNLTSPSAFVSVLLPEFKEE